MAHYDKPCTKEQFSNPNFITDKYPHIIIDGLEMTAENIWNYPDREELVKKLVDYFYDNGFKAYKELSDQDVQKSLQKLRDKDPNEVLSESGEVKNSSPLCLDVCRHYCRDSFYSVKVNGTPSIKDVFGSKALLEKVLKNRMGWFTSTEVIKKKDRTITGEHPYLFDISYKMLIQGCHSSMTSANVSNFRPLIAKWLISKYSPKGKSVLDLSAGWGARYMAAWSLDRVYYGIDPMTSAEIRNLVDFTNSLESLKNTSSSESILVDGCSEDHKSYNSIPTVDYAFACPPYFKLEEYDCEMNSTDVYSNYTDWLDRYWRPTVLNMRDHLADKGKFSLIMVERWGKFNLLADMSKIISDEGFTSVDEVSYKTTRSHLSGKRETRTMSKNSEKIITFERN